MEEPTTKQSSNSLSTQPDHPGDITSSTTGSRTVAATAYVDPLATLTGACSITISEDALILPRVQLDASQGSIHIGAGAMVCEKAIIGGCSKAAPHETENSETSVAADTRIEPFAQLASGVSVGEASIIESQVVLAEGTRVGSHAKICHNVTLSSGTLVGSWEVVMLITPGTDGNLGDMTVTRKRDDGQVGQMAEKFRMRAFKGERAGLIEAMKRSKAVEDQRKRQSIRPPVRKG